MLLIIYTLNLNLYYNKRNVLRLHKCAFIWGSNLL